MAILYFVGLIVFSYYTYKNISYLLFYTKLIRNGVRVMAEVTSFSTYRDNLFLKNAAIPVFSFLTLDSIKIAGWAKHSLNIELVVYQLKKFYEIRYNSKKPTEFVVKNNLEIAACMIMTFLGLGCIGWLSYKFIYQIGPL